MPQISTLKNRSDFLRLRRGKKSVTPYFIMRTASADVPLGDAARVGYTVTTQCGNAVIRNRIKRRLRAVVRELFPTLAVAGQDYILVAIANASPSAANVPYDALKAAMQRLLETR